MSAVRRLQPHSRTYVFRYAAIRLLEVDIFLDRKTAECIAKFIEPLTTAKDDAKDHSGPDWVSEVTVSMGRKFAKPDRDAPREIEKMIHTANSGRIYFEQLHLHPVRLGLTFTQEWIEWNGAETMMIFQFIRGMVGPVCFRCCYFYVHLLTSIFCLFVQFLRRFEGINCECSVSLHVFRCRACLRGTSRAQPCHCYSLLFPANKTDIWNSRKSRNLGSPSRLYFQCGNWSSGFLLRTNSST